MDAVVLGFHLLAPQDGEEDQEGVYLESVLEEHRPYEIIQGPDEYRGTDEEEYPARDVSGHYLARRDGKPDEGGAHHRDE